MRSESNLVVIYALPDHAQTVFIFGRKTFLSNGRILFSYDALKQRLFCINTRSSNWYNVVPTCWVTCFLFLPSLPPSRSLSLFLSGRSDLHARQALSVCVRLSVKHGHWFTGRLRAGLLLSESSLLSLSLSLSLCESVSFHICTRSQYLYNSHWAIPKIWIIQLLLRWILARKFVQKQINIYQLMPPFCQRQIHTHGHVRL